MSVARVFVVALLSLVATSLALESIWYDPSQGLSEAQLAAGYSVVGPNLVLNKNGKLVLTQGQSAGGDFAIIQSVTGTIYGEPLCVTVIDQGAAGSGSISGVTIKNVQRDTQLIFPELDEVCSQEGVFFGCINTASTPVAELPPAGAIAGDFGDELQVSYNSSNPGAPDVEPYSVWLSCGETEEFSFELISTLMIKDSIARNRRKLEGLKRKVEFVQSVLFDNDASCEAIGVLVDLAPAALESFKFLDCIVTRHTQAREFLEDISR
ncbi:hypothetical protein QOT17_010055 [Balamuthia mandrillaris]